ncbi:hypothetical protein AVEN_77671-1 [Araneus ventricosus]|uniref:Uncharacterized protein n=1 Tax=Araneus ventricosus TaxID=182803 RepID=A0A4Y2V3G9_ARAVE|nr:hypothetical protein AVEN_77671-1 [Araneus ventricosus]
MIVDTASTRTEGVVLKAITDQPLPQEASQPHTITVPPREARTLLLTRHLIPVLGVSSDGNHCKNRHKRISPPCCSVRFELNDPAAANIKYGHCCQLTIAPISIRARDDPSDIT